MYYKCKDYTARMEIIDDCERYFIEFHGQIDSPELEVSLDIFNEYYKEFSKPMERQRNEQRRHISNSEINESVNAIEDEDTLIAKYSIEEILKKCTPI